MMIQFGQIIRQKWNSFVVIEARKFGLIAFQLHLPIMVEQLAKLCVQNTTVYKMLEGASLSDSRINHVVADLGLYSHVH